MIVNPTWYELNEFMVNHGLEGKTINIAGPRDLTTERAEHIRELLEEEWQQEETRISYPSLPLERPKTKSKWYPSSSALTIIDQMGGLDTKESKGEFAALPGFRLPQTKRNPFRTRTGRQEELFGQRGE